MSQPYRWQDQGLRCHQQPLGNKLATKFGMQQCSVLVSHSDGCITRWSTCLAKPQVEVDTRDLQRYKQCIAGESITGALWFVLSMWWTTWCKRIWLQVWIYLRLCTVKNTHIPKLLLLQSECMTQNKKDICELLRLSKLKVRGTCWLHWSPGNFFAECWTVCIGGSSAVAGVEAAIITGEFFSVATNHQI